MRFLFVFLLLVILSIPAYAKSPVVVELFTSQFCPDAPPGDAVFQSLVEEDPDVIGISCHVTSFNDERSGTYDALSREFCDDRYSYYFHALGFGSFSVPLVVVNGRYDMAAGVEKLVRSGVRMAVVEDEVAPVDVRVEDGFLRFSLADRAVSGGADIWLFAYGDRHDMEGEAYLNVVEHLVKMKRWDGTAADFAFPLRDIAADGYVVLVQSAAEGVLAAGRVRRYPMSVPGVSEP